MINVTKKWLFLKISSVILIPLMLWFIINLVSIYDKNYLEVVLFFTTQPSKFLFSFLVIFAFFYSALSISEIFEDYLHNEKIKNVANKILFLSAIVIPILTIIMLLFLKV
jgi:succinate dehydrogenase / fumarate reductase membrane anchor subunit|tara:strand:- start:188 stop:517 length:330 start_codon:yes stop_codon:yes gene_type:complete